MGVWLSPQCMSCAGCSSRGKPEGLGGKGNAGAVIDGDMDELPASIAPAAGFLSEQRLTTASRNPAHFLVINVKQLTRLLPDIANTQATRPIAVTQAIFTLAAQNRALRPPGQPDFESNPMRTPAPPAPQLKQPCHPVRRRRPQRAVGPRRAVQGQSSCVLGSDEVTCRSSSGILQRTSARGAPSNSLHVHAGPKAAARNG